MEAEYGAQKSADRLKKYKRPNITAQTTAQRLRLNSRKANRNGLRCRAVLFFIPDPGIKSCQQNIRQHVAHNKQKSSHEEIGHDQINVL